jgi:membrane-associated phospholipid phosphatase
MSGSYTIRTVALVVALGTTIAACSDQSTAPVPEVLPVERAHRSVSELAGAPVSVAWQEHARSLVAANRMSPLAAARVFSALSVAQYRAVAGIDGPGGNPHAAARHAIGGRSTIEGRRGAAAGASVQVLSFFFPAAAKNLEDDLQRQADATPGNVHPAFTRGLAIGRAAGDALVNRVKNDRFTTPWTGKVPTEPGSWVANGPPAGATFGGVTPYFLTSGSQFRPAPPPALGSAAFVADLAEIRTMTDNRTPSQTASALYWDFPTGTFTPIGYWNLVASQYVVAHSLDERAATRAFALTNAAVMDALIGCWDAKYFHWTLRPSQVDGLISLPFGLPNHPSYPSGHSCASAAAAGVLSSLFPDRAADLANLVTEAGLSRMYAGIHYRFDITAGRDLGAAVAQWVLAHTNLVD